MPLPDKPTLADIRHEIDRIDEAVHRLLMERGEVIEALIKVKKTEESGSAFRPAREADVVRRLLERHHGRLPPHFMVHLWRQIISTFTHIQAPHSVHVAGGAQAGAARDFARAHFGFGVPLVEHGSAEAAIAAVQSGRGDLGLIAVGGATSAWWRGLGHGDAPVVMAAAPIVVPRGGDPRPQAVIIANPLTDMAGLDRRLVAYRTAKAPNHADVIACLAGAGGFEVLCWGDAAQSAEAIAAAVSGAAVEAVQSVGYTASPILV